MPLSVFFFDCLYRDGASLFDHPTRERRQALEEILPVNLRTQAIVTSSADEAQRCVEARRAGEAGAYMRRPRARGMGQLRREPGEDTEQLPGARSRPAAPEQGSREATPQPHEPADADHKSDRHQHRWAVASSRLRPGQTGGRDTAP